MGGDAHATLGTGRHGRGRPCHVSELADMGGTPMPHRAHGRDARATSDGAERLGRPAPLVVPNVAWASRPWTWLNGGYACAPHALQALGLAGTSWVWLIVFQVGDNVFGQFDQGGAFFQGKHPIGDQIHDLMDEGLGHVNRHFFIGRKFAQRVFQFCY
jgi:hypothetical protein